MEGIMTKSVVDVKRMKEKTTGNMVLIIILKDSDLDLKSDFINPSYQKT
jgi:hypothetical protein